MIVTAHGADVRFIEQRRATEFSSSGAFLESGGGLLLGALLFSTTTGILAALGVYHVTGSNGWAVMLGTVPGFILAGFLEEVVFRGIIFRIVETSLEAGLPWRFRQRYPGAPLPKPRETREFPGSASARVNLNFCELEAPARS